MKYLAVAAAAALVVWLALVVSDALLVDPILHTCGGAESTAPDGSVACVAPDLDRD